MFIPYHLFWALVAVWVTLYPLVANAFSFTAGTPSQCDDLSISWTGGTAPFQLLIIPVFGTPQNFSIPSNAFNNGKGTYSVQLPLAAAKKFMLTMSDATGFENSVSTDVLVVQSSQGGQSCNTTDPGVAFSFQLNTALTQCRPYVFSDYDDASQPVTIMGIVPSGAPFVLNPSQGSDSFSWTANVAAGTSMIFLMTDARGRQGGSSDIKIVGSSDDSTCLNSQSPSSTSEGSSSTFSPSATTSSAASTTSSATTGGVSIGAIAGTVIGGLIFLAVVITLGLFFLRRKRESGTSGAGLHFRSQSHRLQSAIDLTDDGSVPQNPQHPYILPSQAALASSPYPPPSSNLPYSADPFLDAPPSQYPPSQYGQAPYGQSQYAPSEYATSQYPSSQYAPSTSYQQSEAYQPPLQYHTQTGADRSHADPFDPSALPHLALEPFDMRPAGESSRHDSMSTAQRKAAMAGVSAYKPSRFIMHTDVEDALPSPSEEEVVELPPQYSERRAPLAAIDPLLQPSAIQSPSLTQKPSGKTQTPYYPPPS